MIDEKKLIQDRPEFLNEQQDISMQNEKGGYNKGWNDCLKTFLDIIKDQPKVGEWIPVEERLPEIFENVLIYTKSGHYHIGAYFEERKRWWLGVYWEDSDFILAWQPLPEAYEVKEND